METALVRFAGSLVVAIAVISVPTSASAQSTDAPADKIEELHARIEATSAEAKQVKQLMDEADGDLHALLERRLEAKNLQIVDDVNSLAKLVIEAEEAGEGSVEMRKVITGYLQQLMPAFQTVIDREKKKIVTLISAESPADMSEAISREVDLNHAVTSLVGWYGEYRVSIDNLDAFGIDSTDERAYLNDRLYNLAELLVDTIVFSSRRLKDTRSIVALTPDDQALQTRGKLIELRRDMALSNLATVADLMTEVGLDSTEYKTLILEVSGDVSAGALETDVWAKLLGQWSKRTWTWFTENGLDWLLKIVFLIVILLVARALSRLMRRVTERATSTLNISNLLRRMIVASAANIVLVLGVLLALWQVGVSVGPLLAGLGIAGLIIGFALQDTLSNFASGMMILLYRPYDVGDIIDAGGEFGTVTDMSLVSTVILTFDNQRLVVPNNLIWRGVIRNVTAEKIRRVDMTFGISYDDDIPKAEKILREILDSDERILDDPEPNVRLHALGESSVDFIARPWVKTEDYWDVYWDVTRNVKLRFDAEGISIPFPQRDVHVYDTAPPKPPAPETGDRRASSSRTMVEDG